MFEVLNHYLPSIEASDVLERLQLEEGKFFVVSAHREENINSEKNFKGLMESLNLIADKYHYPIIVSTHPRTQKMIDSKQIEMRPEVQFLKPMGFNDYNALQLNSFAVLSDSGTISEESSTLNFSALNIREAHERPEAMEEASVMMVGLNPERIMQGLKQLQYQKRGQERTFRAVSDYSMPNVSDKMVRIIISYTDYIKRTVWSEPNY
jgi:UDP-N-acetylglucosamine 2-epimerase (non-hydrolysing)